MTVLPQNAYLYTFNNLKYLISPFNCPSHCPSSYHFSLSGQLNCVLLLGHTKTAFPKKLHNATQSRRQPTPLMKEAQYFRTPPQCVILTTRLRLAHSTLQTRGGMTSGEAPPMPGRGTVWKRENNEECEQGDRVYESHGGRGERGVRPVQLWRFPINR